MSISILLGGQPKQQVDDEIFSPPCGGENLNAHTYHNHFHYSVTHYIIIIIIIFTIKRDVLHQSAGGDLHHLQEEQDGEATNLSD